ncbi:MAG: hypothetical protein IJ112_04035 [Oscillospiraceae bacterium]|nr:hypothetical protein [Oscillospiraceae bacterium]
MKRRFWLPMALALAVLLAGCGLLRPAEPAEPTGETTVSDAITKHDVYLTDAGDLFQEYQVVYYGADSDQLRALMIETHYDHDAYKLETLQGIDMNAAYPDFDTLSFASCEITDDGDFYTVAVIFRELDNNEHLHQLDANGILRVDFTSDSEGVSAESYREALVNGGAQLLTAADAAYATLHYELPFA